MASTLLEAQLTGQIGGAFFDVYRELGFGFLEGAYANAFSVELRSRGLHVAREVPIEVVYRGVPVGTYRADMIVEGRVLVEVKAGKAVSEADERQLLNYLKASNCEVGMLLHFGPKPKIRRFIYTNDRK
jgi:GxxExxY protein